MPLRLSNLPTCNAPHADESDAFGLDNERRRAGDIERTDAAKAACSYYWEVFRCSKNRGWEATLTSLFPKSKAWHSETALTADECRFPLDIHKDLKGDAHWRFAAVGATPQCMDVGARALESLHSQQQTNSDSSSAQERFSAPARASTAPPQTRPQPQRNNTLSAHLPPVDSRKVQDINFLRADELHLEHSTDPSGCACESCMSRAGVVELGPLEVITPDGTVTEVTRPTPVETCTSGKSSKTSSLKSAASSLSDSTRRNTVSKIFHGISTIAPRPRSSTFGSLTSKFKRSDSGYGSGQMCAI